MKYGRIIETGTHDDLMSTDGEYANLIQTFYTQQEGDEKLPPEFDAVASTLPISNFIVMR
ncbi:hypothetical protein CHS0354_007191 [Potamilus streckersoni]|uniref:Uncharacterized protein n=1 Tax=Potamilus streckersoni TaxID=2493646 RepID=A0AAE0W768_9BIVA|nr:hypothetical protein CHS0354_007191 [Potamilus streckersoni]